MPTHSILNVSVAIDLRKSPDSFVESNIASSGMQLFFDIENKVRAPRNNMNKYFLILSHWLRV